MVGLTFWHLVLALSAGHHPNIAACVFEPNTQKPILGLAMLASLGITFPVNVLMKTPLYQHWVMLIAA